MRNSLEKHRSTQNFLNGLNPTPHPQLPEVERINFAMFTIEQKGSEEALFAISQDFLTHSESIYKLKLTLRYIASVNYSYIVGRSYIM